MSQTILIDDDPTSPYLFNYLSSYLRTNIIRLSSAAEAEELLEFMPNVALAIVRSTEANRESARRLYQYLSKKDHRTELIVMGVDVELLGLVNCLEEPVNWGRLLSEATQALNEGQEDAAEFTAIPIQHFLEVTTVPCDTYLRIKKNNDKFQFVKLLNAHGDVDHERINKFVERNLRHLYVGKEDARHFITLVANELMKRLESETTVEGRILTTAKSHGFIRDILGQSEFDQPHFDLSEASIEAMRESVINSPKITRLIRFLVSQNVSPYYRHSHLRTLMCHYVLSRQKWYRTDHLQILSFISFYHGMLLSSAKQLLPRSVDELRSDEFTEQERQEVLEQPRALVQLLDAHPELTDYIRTVLIQSQGSRDGLGLQGDPAEDLHALSKVFIVADQFVKILLDPKLPSTKKDILPILAGQLTNPSYQKIISSLEHKYT